MAEAANQRPYDEDEINLLDYWRVIWKYKWLIGILSSTSVVAAMIFGLLSPQIYQSTATILIPKERGGGGLLSAIGASGIAGQITGISLPSFTPNRDIFISILKSRTLARKMVEEFGLKDHYKALHFENAITALKGATKVSVSKEGVIELRVSDTDPRMASNIVNGYPVHLDRLMTDYGTGAAGRQRRFMEDQLTKTKVHLKMAEEALKDFQQKNRAISIKEQATGAIAAGGRIKGEIMASEVQLQVMHNFATELNPEVIRLKRKIAELKHQLAQVHYDTIDLPGVTANPGHPKKDIYLPTVKVPAVSLELARLTRDLKVHATVYSLLTQQLEQVKIAEAKDTPVVQVLDHGVPALRKSKPRIKRNMVLAGAVSLFFGIFLAFFLEYIQRQKQQMVNSEQRTANS